MGFPHRYLSWLGGLKWTDISFESLLSHKIDLACSIQIVVVGNYPKLVNF